MKRKLDWFDDLNLKAAKHLVKLGVIKDWKKAYENMTKRRKKRERDEKKEKDQKNEPR
jgi:hypothetical protein